MKRNSDSFLGGPFVWFTGVVEDRFDPEEMNRVRVRCIGFHSESKTDIDTEDLPLATVMMPATSSGTSGIGTTPHGLMEGSWVVGFFRDGQSAQDPVIMGTIASSNTERTNEENIGFVSDSYPRPEHVGESDVNFAARETKHKQSNAFLERNTEQTNENLFKNAVEAKGTVEVATPPDLLIRQVPGATYYEKQPYKHMPPLGDDRIQGQDGPHVPQYPYNKVNESECGHIVETDCTPGHERTHRMHKSGTYEEIYTDGTRSVKIKGEDYEVIVSNKNIHIMGNCNMTVDGDLRQLVYGNYHLEVEKEMSVKVGGSLQQKIGKNLETEIGLARSTYVGEAATTGTDTLVVVGNSTTNILEGDKLVTVGGNSTQTVTGGNIGITSSTGNLNLFNAGTFGHTSLGNSTLTVDGTLDIDTTTQITMDVPNFSLDFTTGNITTTSGTITSQTRTLHSHTHGQDDTGADATTQGDTLAPNANT